MLQPKTGIMLSGGWFTPFFKEGGLGQTPCIKIFDINGPAAPSTLVSQLCDIRTESENKHQ